VAKTIRIHKGLKRGFKEDRKQNSSSENEMLRSVKRCTGSEIVKNDVTRKEINIYMVKVRTDIKDKCLTHLIKVGNT
jgi:hypothetical protein